MLQLVGYGTSLVRNTKLRVLAREREQTQRRLYNAPISPKNNWLHVSVSNSVNSFIYDLGTSNIQCACVASSAIFEKKLNGKQAQRVAGIKLKLAILQ